VPREYGEALEARLRRAIARIEGISTVGLVLDEKEQIVEIHLVSSSARQPKRVVRDVESLLYAQFGIRVDYRRISLVQIDASSGSGQQKRIQFLSAQPSPTGTDSVQVILQDSAERYEGTAPLAVVAQGGSDHGGATAAAAALATLAALQQALANRVRLVLQEAQTVAANGDSIALVMILAATPQGEEHLSGTCIVGNDLCAAVAKATLDAVNRRLPFWSTSAER
jgi:hypothetical protein